MKKIKLLAPFMGALTIPMIITPLASCSCNNGSQISNTITLVTTQKEWKNPTGGSISVEFNLSKELGTNEELTGPTFPEDSGLSTHNASFDSDATWKVEGKKAIATMKFKDFSGGSYITADKINFNIENKSTKQVISKATLTNFKVYWESEVIHVTGVTLDKPTLNLNIGDEETLTPTIAPVDATNQEVTWSSDPESVATVDDGVVTPVAEGTATITCTSVDNPNAKATCTVTVNPQMTMFSWFAELYNILLTDTLYPTNTKQYAKENISLKVGGETKTITNVEYDFNTKTLPQHRYANIVYKKDGDDETINLFNPIFLMQIIGGFEPETTANVKYSKKNGIYSYINKNEGSTSTTKEISFDKNGYLLCWDDATLSGGKIEITYNGDPQPLQTITQEYWAKACKSAISINTINASIPSYYSQFLNPIVQYNKDQIGLKFGEQASTINSIEYAKDASDIWKGTLKYKKDGTDYEMLVLGKDLESKLPTAKESEDVIYTIDDKNGFVYENKTATTGLSKISFNKYGYYTGETNAESKDAPTVVTYDGIPLKTCNIAYSDTDNKYKIDYSPSFMSENENIIFNVTLDENHSVNTFYFVDTFGGGEAAVPVTNVSCPADWTYNSETNKFTTNTPVSTGTLQFKVSIPKTYPTLDIKLVNE